MHPQTSVLNGVVAVVHCSDGDSFVRSAIANKLLSLGADVRNRLNNEVTHVVYKGLLTASRVEQDADLWELYNKIDKQQRPPVVVSPLWLDDCVQKRIRAMVCWHNSTCHVPTSPHRNTSTSSLGQRAARVHG